MSTNPKIDSAGHKRWYQNGELHRENGPAIERPDGGKRWFLDGKELTEDEFDLHLFQLWLKTGKNYFV